MFVREIFREGGWDTKKTQSTVLKPAIVSAGLKVVDQFVNGFNKFLSAKSLGPVMRGRPTGSSAYHEQDAAEDPDKIYGDIDLQMIAPPVEGAKSHGTFVDFWNKQAQEYIETSKISFVDTEESKPGHPIFQIGASDYVQIDFMWHEERLSKWGAARVTPERGVKGLLFGNMFSVFGELIDMSIQHAGVQLKVIDGKKVPFSKQKDTKIVTVSIDPNNFILDTFKYLAKEQGIENPKIDKLLSQFPGNDTEDVKIEKLVNGVKGFARSCELNQMFGKESLAAYANYSVYLNKFWNRYEEKAMLDVTSSKRQKADTPQAIARAQSDKDKVLSGLEKVKGYFKS